MEGFSDHNGNLTFLDVGDYAPIGTATTLRNACRTQAKSWMCYAESRKRMRAMS